ncbi:hypothetical protein [Fulvivirga ligni]|uniref:hypothetical protein n=1 Tax=Fulvivirga ligni TaxID=2904246 RepID=UPI001F284F38|nr:hypothetical protein [Fulvivirga ligni]UII19490.1 hypothetical protein LVD16_16745 [Fulvivirga ligni]
MILRRSNLFILLFIITTTLGYGQKFESFDRKEWEDITKEIDYSDGRDENTRNKRGSNDESVERGDGDEYSSSDSSGPSWSIPAFGGQVFQFIMILVLVAVLVFVLYKILGSHGGFNPKNKKLSDNISVEDLEEKLMESDLLIWLKKAVSDKNYKLALRIYYLMIIKELSLKGIIHWKKEKTNLEYMMEMRDHESYNQFEEVTNIYHLVWYGDKNVGDPYLINASHKFKAYFQSINPAQGNE